MAALDRDRIERAAKRLESVHGALNAHHATASVLRYLDSADMLADILLDVWTATGEPGDWDRAKAEATVADFDAPEVPTANWPHGQGVNPMPPQTLQDIRDRNAASTDETATALLNEIDRLAYEVRIWQFNCDIAQRANTSLRENWKRTVAGDKATLKRLWRLIDHKRKTLPMAALFAALQNEEEGT